MGGTTAVKDRSAAIRAASLSGIVSPFVPFASPVRLYADPRSTMGPTAPTTVVIVGVCPSKTRSASVMASGDGSGHRHRPLNRMVGQLVADIAKYARVSRALNHPVPTLFLKGFSELGINHFAFVVFCGTA